MQEELYAKLDEYAEKAYEQTFDFSAKRASFEVWKKHGDYMVPYTKASDLNETKDKYPEDCYSSGSDDGIDNNDIQNDNVAGPPVGTPTAVNGPPSGNIISTPTIRKLETLSDGETKTVKNLKAHGTILNREEKLNDTPGRLRSKYFRRLHSDAIIP